MTPRKIAMKPLNFENYLAMAEASTGLKLWRTLYFKIGSQRKDILKNGELSCAFYVSSLLRIFGLIENIHTTVHGTAADLTACGWKKTRAPIKGDVVIWSPITTKSGEQHAHIGIYLGNGVAINHNDQGKVPMKHPVDYRPVAYFLRCPAKLK